MCEKESAEFFDLLVEEDALKFPASALIDLKELEREMGRPTIQIAETLGGSYIPDWVRESWKGVRMEAYGPTWVPRTIIRPAYDLSDRQGIRAYVVPREEALKKLRKETPQAAQWFDDKLSDAKLFFFQESKVIVKFTGFFRPKNLARVKKLAKNPVICG